VRILLLEYVTGGGIDPAQSSASLIAEGLLMRNALLADLAEIPGITVVILHDGRIDNPGRPHGHRVEYLPVSSARAFELAWRTQLARCDAVWPIAPETGGVLARLCRDAEVSGCALLTSSSAAVEVAGSKHQTIEALCRSGIPAISTRQANPGLVPSAFPVVVKPDDGAGCDGLRILGSAREWRDWMAGTEWMNGIVQPLMAGDPRSVSALFARGRARLLSCNRQALRVTGGRFELGGCAVNLPDTDRDDAERLAAAVATAIPELWGYAGIDFLQTGTGPVVLEVNPRLTTSYVGLRMALGINVAARVLDLWMTGELPSGDLPRGKTVHVAIGDHHAG